MKFNPKDDEGKIYFKSYLEKKGFKNIILTPYIKCHWDIEAEKDGYKYYFELKLRPINSDAYGDSIIQLDKLNYLKELKGDNTKIYIVNLFKDCFYIVPIDDEYEEQHLMCQKTNNWDRTRVKKVIISYPHKKINRREYI